MTQVMRKMEVNVIPATKRSVENGGQIKKQKFLRVAAYCRVSTEDESQQTSYTTQNTFYTQMISWHPGWTLAGIYADEAISGTSRVKRKDFNRMMDDAQEGKMDYIITKSISRFARNTVDTLNCVRQLRQMNPPVGIFFEKENIDTLDATGELILTILSALAQDESRSISDNIRWSIQRKFQRGEVIVDLKRMLGYDKGPDEEWVINPEQSEIVRYIFERFVCGDSANRIAKALNEKGKKTARGNVWRADAILFILRNEKYVGDVEMQKTITKDFLTHESTINNGEATKYYVKDHHVGIVSRLKWDKVQAMLLAGGIRPDAANAGDNVTVRHRGSKASPFANLVCGADNCGEKLFRIGYNTPLPSYKDERSIAVEGGDPMKYKERYYFYYPVWRCIRNARGRRNPGRGKCSAGAIHECALEQSFMEMLYKLKRDYNTNGESSQLLILFREVCKRIECQTGNNSYSAQRLELLELQIGELEEKLSAVISRQMEARRYTGMRMDGILSQEFENDDRDSMSGKNTEGNSLYGGISDAGIRMLWGLNRAEADGEITEECEESEESAYIQLAEDIRRRINELKGERDIFENGQEVTIVIHKNFDFFLRCLNELPEENCAGIKMNINGLDVTGSIFRDLDGRAITGKRSSVKSGRLKITEEKIKQAPDLLNFEKGIYMAFIKSGLVKGNDVEYMTNFGVKLTSKGNRRTMSSFLGFRRAHPDGTIEILDENWKISGRAVCYVRTESDREERGRGKREI